jgi:hypothetical protein
MKKIQANNSDSILNHKMKIFLDALAGQEKTLQECALALILELDCPHIKQHRNALNKILAQFCEFFLESAQLRENSSYWCERCKKAEETVKTLNAKNADLKKGIIRGIIREANFKTRETDLKTADFSSEDSISILGLSVRTHNSLYRHGAKTLGDVLNIEPAELKRVRNLGTKSQNEVIDKMRDIGFIAWARKQKYYI